MKNEIWEVERKGSKSKGKWLYLDIYDMLFYEESVEWLYLEDLLDYLFSKNSTDFKYKTETCIKHISLYLILSCEP